MAKMSSPAETERCIESLTAVFWRYAGKDSNSSTLSKTEFLTFMNTELAAFTKNQKDLGILDHRMKKLDVNSDVQLEFQEFLNLTGSLGVACHESFSRSRKYTRGALGAGLHTNPLSFQLPSHHHLLMDHTYPEPSRDSR
ncbi:protein S100-A11-like [Pteronotus mesoamericanus]|uniref:protein S100-A11-like n=1 Tax=Pteronotus mesoamericanus TaxID=1884717 RepID=UPI0023EDB884|nr:protein S100-A11-like [Pteronotus parnellii mesoamericanus]